jgi:hypothetical protein
MSDKRPTEKAILNFARAKAHGRMAQNESTSLKGEEQMFRSHIAVSIQEMNEGLESLTTGIRATYLLLEEVKRLLERR